jgi:hypothetical protein
MNYEVHDASLRLIGIGAALLGAGVIAAFGISLCLYAAHLRSFGQLPSNRQSSFTHGTTATPDVTRDWARVSADADTHLHRYRWVDRDAGVAAIPIDRAMSLFEHGAQPAPAPKVPGQVP